MMAKAWHTVILLLGVWTLAQPILNTPAEAQLSPYFYLDTCPQVYPIVALGVYQAIQQETRNAASLLRLHFHDCFVQGCDGSVLLNDTATNTSEKSAVPNRNSLRGFSIIDTIKASLESSCPGVVSCADIVALSAFFSVVWSGGPIWLIPLGRRDSFFSNFPETSQLPPPFANISALKQNFAFQNLTVTDLVALSGGHTIGLARCVGVTPRLYNFNATFQTDPTLNTTLAQALETTCPSGGDGNVTTNMDIQTPTVFDNLYYKNLILSDGLFSSDQELYDAANDTNALVQQYANDQSQFFTDFANGMIKMGDLNVLTGSEGEIRTNCAVSNNVTNSVEEIVNLGAEVRKSDKDETGKGRESEKVEEIENAVETFQVMVKKVLQDIVLEELEKLLVEDTVTDTVSGGHSSI
ncbi:unnamed protein product [Calypogeia fissa]